MLRPARLALHQQIQSVGAKLFFQKSFDALAVIANIAATGQQTQTLGGATPQGHGYACILGDLLYRRLPAEQRQHHKAIRAQRLGQLPVLHQPGGELLIQRCEQGRRDQGRLQNSWLARRPG